MKRFIPILLLLGGFSSPAMADIIHTISASTQLRVDAAATDATRIGSTYSVQGTNITAGTMGGLGQANETTGVAATHSDGVYTVTTAGDAFSLTESFIAGDKTNALGAGVDVTVLPNAGMSATIPYELVVTALSPDPVVVLLITLTSTPDPIAFVLSPAIKLSVRLNASPAVVTV